MREVVLDTETTGVERADGDRVIEIGCVELIDREPTGRTFQTYCNPAPRRNNPRAFKVHGLSEAFLARKPRFEDIAEEFCTFIAGAQLVIHNAPFDVGMLNAEFARLYDPPEPIKLDAVVDTLQVARRTLPQLKSKGLDALCSHFKINAAARAVRHGALTDAEILARVYRRLCAPQQGGLDLGVVEQAQAAETAPLPPPRPLRGITPEEAARHAAFVASLGPSAVWNDYLGEEA